MTRDLGTHVQGVEAAAGLLLNRLRVSHRHMLSPGVRDFTISIGDQYLERIYDGLLVELNADVLAEHLAADTATDTVKVPASWWQHAKHDAGATQFGFWWRTTRLGEWCARRWPTRYRQHVLEARWDRWATRPMSTLPDYEFGEVVYREAMSQRLRRAD